MLHWLLAAALIFPDVQARNLDGHAVTSRDLEGHPTAVLLGFDYASRTEVEAWARQLAAETQGALPVIVMPVYPAMPALVRGWIDGAMARDTAPAMRRYAWTTTDRDALLTGLNLDKNATDVAVLLDAHRDVRCLEQGAPTAARLDAFLRAWRAMRGDDR